MSSAWLNWSGIYTQKPAVLELKLSFLFGMEEYDISKNPINLTPADVRHWGELLHWKKTVEDREGWVHYFRS